MEMKDYIEYAKSKIELKLWSVDYAKGYCFALLNNLCTPDSADEYDELAKQIDDLECLEGDS